MANVKSNVKSNVDEKRKRDFDLQIPLIQIKL